MGIFTAGPIAGAVLILAIKDYLALAFDCRCVIVEP